MTEAEKERMKEVEKIVHLQLEVMGGDELASEIKAQIIGSGVSTFDALFAIRDGETWRGITGAEEIARAVLREAGIGE